MGFFFFHSLGFDCTKQQVGYYFPDQGSVWCPPPYFENWSQPLHCQGSPQGELTADLVALYYFLTVATQLAGS